MDYREINRATIAAFRAGGEIPGMHRERLLLLTTTGRRTGEPHTSPMMFIPIDGRVLVVASNLGAVLHPDWYLNLAAAPQVTVELGDEKYSATATTTEGDDRERLWSFIAADYSFFTEHQAQTERQIPIVELTRL